MRVSSEESAIVVSAVIVRIYPPRYFSKVVLHAPGNFVFLILRSVYNFVVLFKKKKKKILCDVGTYSNFKVQNTMVYCKTTFNSKFKKGENLL